MRLWDARLNFFDEQWPGKTIISCPSFGSRLTGESSNRKNRSSPRLRVGGGVEEPSIPTKNKKK